jgi:cellulose synthase (UDP-forming)
MNHRSNPYLGPLMDRRPPDRSMSSVKVCPPEADGNAVTGHPIGIPGRIGTRDENSANSKAPDTACVPNHDIAPEDNEYRLLSVSTGLPNRSRAVPSGLLRAASVIFLGALAWYLPWLFVSVRNNDLWLTVPLEAANLLTAISMLLAISNNWFRRIPEMREVPAKSEPTVGILIPTYGEEPAMVVRTIESVLSQDWPERRLVIVVGDDAHNPLMKKAVSEVAAGFPAAQILYHEPPPRGDPLRRGDAKAGNLNSCYSLLNRRFDVKWVETRDADDAVGSNVFLRNCVGQLMTDHRLGFVQTIKSANVSPSDPFDNNFVAFYRGNMFARHAANAVFPCGSGLVWRCEALDDIGGFPDWNLVEDLQSGVNALRRGWHGSYVPIVGVHSQHAPEDIPNVYKQRGTWALDTLRLLLWADLSGLNWRQRFHFAEPALYYLQSFGTIAMICVTLVTLVFHVHPIEASSTSYWMHLLPFVLSLEFLLMMLAGAGSMKQALKMRVMLIGLFPVFSKAFFLAVIYGPRRKPAYKVTRKVDEFAWYWRETLVQSLCIVALLFGIIYDGLIERHRFALDPGALYWGLFFAIMLAVFVRKSWYGVFANDSIRAPAAPSLPRRLDPKRIELPFTAVRFDPAVRDDLSSANYETGDPGLGGIAQASGELAAALREFDEQAEAWARIPELMTL